MRPEEPEGSGEKAAAMDFLERSVDLWKMID
jgi:hypothetical protein